MTPFYGTITPSRIQLFFFSNCLDDTSSNEKLSILSKATGTCAASKMDTTLSKDDSTSTGDLRAYADSWYECDSPDGTFGGSVQLGITPGESAVVGVPEEGAPEIVHNNNKCSTIWAVMRDYDRDI